MKIVIFFEMLGHYILDGFKIAIIVSAMLIGFISIISMLNGIFDSILGVTFQEVLGYVFYPIAFLLGISPDHCASAGEIMATKLVTNEFVAMGLFDKSHVAFSEHEVSVISVFLVSFANLSSIGIIMGSIKAISEKQSKIVAKYGIKILLSATMCSIISANITGLLI